MPDQYITCPKCGHKIQLTDSRLRSNVDALWDRFWSGGIANPLTAIEQKPYHVEISQAQKKLG